ncbi:hypothetical protein [Bacteroides heparinolyticus]|nr:hypothetical protein [Bacteroides heparinolyticus]
MKNKNKLIYEGKAQKNNGGMDALVSFYPCLTVLYERFGYD